MIQRSIKRLSLRALSSWDGRFPGFGHDTHRDESRNGTYHVQCLLTQPRGNTR
jgi:hypothetical protein